MDMKENIEPKDGMEYIYNVGMIWPIYDKDIKTTIGREVTIGSMEEFDALEVKPYSINLREDVIAIDVKSIWNEDKGYHSRYEFTIKGWGLRCTCHYPWAFWENTPNNLDKISCYKRELKELEKQNKVVDGLRECIDKLYISEKDNTSEASDE